MNCNSIQLIFQIDKFYRSPNDNLELFLKSLELTLLQINKRYKNIICGDINIDIMRNSNINNEYLNIMARNGFLPCINDCTRVTNHSNTCIDHIFVRNIDSNTVISNILRCDITDHYSTILIIVNKIGFNHLNVLIWTENWYSCLNYDNVDDMIKVFNLKIKEFINYSTIFMQILTNQKKCENLRNGLLWVS